MPRFMAVHTAPFTEEQWKERMASGDMPSFPPGVVCNLTYCDFADGKFFCDWEAPNKEIVEQVIKGMGMPLDAVYPVRLFDWAKMEIEP
jgi:hypothetical protein